MKSKTPISAFILICIIIISCAACGTDEGSSEPAKSTETPNSLAENTKVEPSTSANIPKSDEMSQEPELIELNNTYTTRFKEVNAVTFPSFMFDYPNDWTIINEEVTAESERVELTNDRDVIVRYEYIVPSYGYGNTEIDTEAEISKVADSNFISGYAQTTDYSNLGKFVVAKVKTNSEKYYYSVKPESECGSHTINGNFITAFWYDGLLQFMAEIPETLTSREEQEVIAILSSFRVSKNETSAIEVDEKNMISEEEQIYTELKKGDFSHFAGTYKPCGAYDDLYGGGEHLPDLVLQENGIITGGLVYGSYPEMKPIAVTKNEDNAYLCQVRYSGDSEQDYFLIYPEGVIGENPYIYNDPFLTETVYIQYISVDGGISDIIYYKVKN